MFWWVELYLVLRAVQCGMFWVVYGFDMTLSNLLMCRVVLLLKKLAWGFQHWSLLAFG